MVKKCLKAGVTPSAYEKKLTQSSIRFVPCRPIPLGCDAPTRASRKDVRVGSCMNSIREATFSSGFSKVVALPGLVAWIAKSLWLMRFWRSRRQFWNGHVLMKKIQTLYTVLLPKGAKSPGMKRKPPWKKCAAEWAWNTFSRIRKTGAYDGTSAV